MHPRLVHFNDKSNRSGGIVPSDGGVGPLMILGRSICQRLGEFQSDVLSDGKAEDAVGSVGQSEGEAAGVMADGFLFDEGKGCEFNWVQCRFGLFGFEEGEGEKESRDDYDRYGGDYRERKGAWFGHCECDEDVLVITVGYLVISMMMKIKNN